MGAAADRRQFRRYDLQFPCFVRPWKKREKAFMETDAVRAVTVNISSGGFYLHLPFDWIEAFEWIRLAKIDCLIHLPARTVGQQGVGIRCRGRIVRAEAREPGNTGFAAMTEKYAFVRLRGIETGVDAPPITPQ